ncbi:MAG TPA: SCO family protein [Vicinamibacterales bacterium]
MTRATTLAMLIASMVMLAGLTASAQKMTGSPSAAGYRQVPGQPSSTIPAPLREIGFDQNLDQHIPLDTSFKDESGRVVRLGEYFGKRPVVLLFAYYDCPMLCTQVISGLAGALNVLSLQPGRDFEIVTVSFDPRDTPESAGSKKAHFIERYQRPGAAAAWHFLTGDEASIRTLTKAAGFRYVWDEPTKQFAHPSGVIVLTPDGRLARYLFGIEYGPRDLRFALVEASEGKVGNPADALLLYCYHYDPMTGRYGLVIMRALRLAGIATVFALAAFIIVMVRRERRSQNPVPRTQHPAEVRR